MITGYRDTICQPEQHFFKLIAENNRNIFETSPIGLSPVEKHSIRRQMLEAAETFMTMSQHRLTEEGVRESFTDQIDDTRIVVMTGHQPVIYHSGLLFKNQVLSEYVGSSDSIGINVIVDIDRGSAGQFFYPDGKRDTPVLEKGDIYGQEGVYEFQSLNEHERINKELSKCEEALLRLGFEQEALRVRKTLALYNSIRPGSALVANMLVRRAFERSPDYLEVPFSRLLDIPEVQKFLVSFISNFEKFHLTYNTSLHEHREEHNIKNLANPFPDLKQLKGYLELPFWFIDDSTGTRESCYLKREDKVLIFSNGERVIGKLTAENGADFPKEIRLVPGGMLVTLLLRTLFSDLFIHGRGGGRYDVFTDRFIRAYFAMIPPVFVTASGSRHLFKDEIKWHEEFLEHEKQKREMIFRPKEFLDSSLWSEVEKSSLSELVEKKEALIAELKRRKSINEPAQEIGISIRQVDENIKSIVSKKFDSISAEAKVIQAGAEKIVYFREFPYFFFDDVAFNN